MKKLLFGLLALLTLTVPVLAQNVNPGMYQASPDTIIEGQKTPLLTDSNRRLVFGAPPAGTSSASVAVSITRPADTTAYTAGDVVGPTAAAISFPSISAAGAEVLITSASLEIDVTAVPSGMTTFRLYLYNVTPPSALADNAAWDLPSGDRASYLGYLDMGTPVDLGSTLYVELTNPGKVIKTSGTGVFAYLVTAGAFTPASATVKVITLHFARL